MKDRKNINTEVIDLEKLIEELGSKDGMKRKKARRLLVAQGKKSIDLLTELVDNPKHINRWEALKSLEEIGNSESIPVFIKALDDDYSDVRWIAAKGLIKVGKKSLKPLLELILENSDSVFVLSGAHHVIHALREKELLPDDFPTEKILSLLKNPGWEESLKINVHRALKELKK
jgi:HEAT repeat protein